MGWRTNCDSAMLAEWLRPSTGGRKEAFSLNRARSDYEQVRMPALPGIFPQPRALGLGYEQRTLHRADIRNQHPRRLELDLDLPAGHLESGRRPISRLASGLERGAEMGAGRRRVIALFRVDSASRTVSLARGQGAGFASAPDHSLSVRRSVKHRTRAADAEDRVPDGGGRPNHQHNAGYDLSGSGGFQRSHVEDNRTGPRGGRPAARAGHDLAGMAGADQHSPRFVQSDSGIPARRRENPARHPVERD